MKHITHVLLQFRYQRADEKLQGITQSIHMYVIFQVPTIHGTARLMSHPRSLFSLQSREEDSDYQRK